MPFLIVKLNKNAKIVKIKMLIQTSPLSLETIFFMYFWNRVFMASTTSVYTLYPHHNDLVIIIKRVSEEKKIKV